MAALLLIAACSKPARDLTLAVTTEEPAPSVAEAIRSHLDSHGFALEVEVAANSAAAIEAVLDGRLDLAVIEEPDRPIPGLTTLAPLYPSVLHILHDRDAAPGDFRKLISGATVYAGPTGGTGYRLLMHLASDFGVPADAFRVLDNPWTETPDVYFVFGGLLSSDSLAQLGGYRLFSFADDDDIEGGSTADGIVLRHHHLRTFLLPRMLYPQLDHGAIQTLATRTVLVAREDFDQATSLDLSATLYTHAEEISLEYPLVTRELSEDVDPANLMLPLHPGTRRYIDRDRPGYLERNAEVIALVFTVLVTLASGTIALYRYRAQVRKDRVDEYYQRLLDIRSQIEAAHGDADTLLACRGKVLNVQREVLDLLVDERIAADLSMIAFITLSNQIINELEGASGTFVTYRSRQE